MHTRSLIVVLASIALSAMPARAGTLAASKASQLVTLSATPGCPGGGKGFTTVVSSAGTLSAFTIPPKQVFVITGLNFTAGP